MADTKKPTKDHELPQGRKDWTDPPQRKDGPEGPAYPAPEDLGAGEANYKKPYQQVKPKPEEPVEQPDPTGEMNWDPKPQQVDGGEGPAPTDGTELTEAVNSVALSFDSSGKPTGATAAKKGSSGQASKPDSKSPTTGGSK